MFTNRLHFRFCFYRFPFRFPCPLHSIAESSSLGSLTRIASSPTHSILHHGITRSHSLESPRSPEDLGTIKAEILPSVTSNSKSQAYPSLAPSQRFRISFSRNTSVLIRFIKAPPFFCRYLRSSEYPMQKSGGKFGLRLIPRKYPSAESLEKSAEAERSELRHLFLKPIGRMIGIKTTSVNKRGNKPEKHGIPKTLPKAGIRNAEVNTKRIAAP